MRTQTILIDTSGINDLTYPVAIEPDTEFWYEWLENHKSFHFRCPSGHFTANKDSRYYWTASRKVNGKLRRKRLGKSSGITYRRLSEAATILAVDLPRGFTRENARQFYGELVHELKQANTRIYLLEQEIDRLRGTK